MSPDMVPLFVIDVIFGNYYELLRRGISFYG